MPKDELIAALEKAAEPDGWLDYLLWPIAVPNHPRWTIGSVGDLDDVPLWGDPRKDRDWDRMPPPFTGSIDAALTLVTSSKGHDPWWMLKAAWRGKAKAEVWVDGRGKPFRGEAATPAIAIVIAALRARLENTNAEG